MKENELNIRARVDGLKEDLKEVYSELQKLREAASDTGKDIEKEMAFAARGVDEFRVRSMQAAKEIKKKSALMREYADKLRSAGVSVSAYSTAIDSLNKASSKTSKKQVKKTQELKMAAKAYDKTVTSIRELRNEKLRYDSSVTTLQQRLIQLRAAKEQNIQATSQMSIGYQGIMRVANQLAGAFGFGFGLYGVLRLLRHGVTTIRDFELAQKQLEAVTGATMQQMERFAQEAIRVGSASIFGAEKVTKLQVQLAKMGFAIPDINQMTESIVRLAMATQEDLGKAAETVAFTIRAYQLDASETARVTDTMARSFTASALDLEKFRQSMKYIAPIANQANFTLEETVAILGKVADAGISGSLAGTSMRNIIFQMSDSMSELTKRTNVTINGFDDFTKALWELHHAGTDLEDVFDIMDRRAASVFTLLIESVGSLDEFHDKILDAGGAAERMANIQMESLAYHIQIARRSWEGFILSLDKGEGTISTVLKTVFDRFSGVMEGLTFNMQRQSRIIVKQMDYIRLLTDTVMDSNLSLERREKAIRELTNQYPEYFNKLDSDITKTGELVSITNSLLAEQEELLKFRLAQEERDNLQRKYERDIKLFDEHILKTKDLQRLARETGLGLGDMVRRSMAGFGWLQREITLWMRNSRQAMRDFEGDIEAANKALIDKVWQQDVEFIIEFLQETDDPETFFKKTFESVTKEYAKGVSDIVNEQKRLRQESELTSEEIEEGNRLISESYNESRQAIIDEIRERREQDKSYKSNIDGLKGLAATNVLANVQMQDQIRLQKENLVMVAMLEVALKALTDGYKGLADESEKLTREQIRNRLQAEELQLRTMHEGIELEQKLAEERKKAAYEVAETYGRTEDNRERQRLKRLADLQYEIARQEIIIAQMREQNTLTDEATTRQRDLMNIRRQMIDEALRAREFAIDPIDTESMYRIEEQRIREHYKRRAIDAKNAAKDETLSIERAYDERIIQVGNNEERIAELKEEMSGRIKAVEENNTQEIILLNREMSNALMDMERQRMQQAIQFARQRMDVRMREFDAQQEIERAIFLSQRRLGHERHEFERQQHQERLQRLLEEKQALLAVAHAAQMAALDEAAELGIILDTSESQREIQELITGIERLRALINNPEFDYSEWESLRDAIRSIVRGLGDAFTRLARDREQHLRREREMMDRHVDESDRAFERQLQLRAEGFASDVEAARAHHEKMKRLRREAVMEEQRAAEQMRRVEAMVQSMNLLTSASELMKSTTQRYGALGPLVSLAVAGTAMVGLFSLWSNVRRRSAAATRYTKGGGFIAKGPSHAGGGVLLAKGHEAQGGEGVSVWNRTVTRKSWPQIKALTDTINSGGKLGESPVNVFADNKDITAIRRLLEKGTEEYADGYMIRRRGNYTLRCRLN